MTNREKFDVIAEVFATVDRAERDEILEFVKAQKEALDRKNTAAKKRAAEKRAAGDELRARIEAVIGEEPITVNGIIDALGEEGLTPAKVTARTKQLYAAGLIEKTPIKLEGRKLMAYTKA